MPKTLELVGKIVERSLKDVGKGKDAEPHEVVVVKAKLDSADGIRGTLCFAPGPRADEFDLGEPVTITVELRQGRLGLRAAGQRED